MNRPADSANTRQIASRLNSHRRQSFQDAPGDFAGSSSNSLAWYVGVIPSNTIRIWSFVKV